MGWKQPIDIDLKYKFGDDMAAYQLFVNLIIEASNSDKTVRVGSKFIKTTRGQVAFSRRHFANLLGWSPTKVNDSLQRVCNLYQLGSQQKNHSGTVVTLLDYDDLVGMKEPVKKPVKEPARSQQGASNQVS